MTNKLGQPRDNDVYKILMEGIGMRSFRHSLLLCATALSAGVVSHAAHANEFSYFTTVYDTDFETAGVGGLRGSGSGTLSVSGVTGSVTSSYLYWAGPTNSTNPNVNSTVSVGGSTVTGTNIGFSDDNFWGYQNSQAYRANTSSVITGNGSYALSNFNKPSDGAEVNGAGALIFSNDGVATNNRDVVVYDGNDSNFASQYDPAGWNFNLNGIRYTSGQAYLTLMVSDGQNFGQDDDGSLYINGQLLASGGLFQGDSLPGGTGPTGNGNLWDIKTFNITPFLTPGVDNLDITLSDGSNDAIAGIVAAVDLPAGAAPLSTVPLPASAPLFGIGLLALGVAGYGLKARRGAAASA